jgi:hypothetical protein
MGLNLFAYNDNHQPTRHNRQDKTAPGLFAVGWMNLLAVPYSSIHSRPPLGNL